MNINNGRFCGHARQHSVTAFSTTLKSENFPLSFSRLSSAIF